MIYSSSSCSSSSSFFSFSSFTISYSLPGIWEAGVTGVCKSDLGLLLLLWACPEGVPADETNAGQPSDQFLRHLLPELPYRPLLLGYRKCHSLRRKRKRKRRRTTLLIVSQLPCHVLVRWHHLRNGQQNTIFINISTDNSITARCTRTTIFVIHYLHYKVHVRVCMLVHITQSCLK